jgi:hypothetical protein
MKFQAGLNRASPQGQAQDEAGAAAWGFFQHQASIMGLRQGTAQGQANARALFRRFRGDEGFKNPFPQVGRHAGAIISHTDGYLTCLHAN